MCPITSDKHLEYNSLTLIRYLYCKIIIRSVFIWNWKPRTGITEILIINKDHVTKKRLVRSINS